MKLKFAVGMLAVFFLAFAGNESKAQSNPPPPPNPVLYFIGQELYTANSASYIRYRYGVFNSSAYPNAMFAPAPSLPPCGANANASRTWVDLFDQRGKRLNGFCALGTGDHLNSIWFALPEGEVPPSWIYVELTDRQTATKYKSNLADTTN
ncbi:MAG: hypothetical protein DMF63_06805 [Acidobacteria bacterium]|nr:MAG: hypothetical protein DMF63_06805 [Acidobacteriota bacterium]